MKVLTRPIPIKAIANMLPFYRSARAKLVANDSGQAMVEFAFIVPMLLILMCAAIDFGRALYTLQVVAQLTRQGSSLASRIDTCAAAAGLPQPQEPMETLSCSTQAVIAGESGLNIGTSGEVIMTAVQNTGTTASPIYTMEGQYSQGGISQTSKVGTYVDEVGPLIRPHCRFSSRPGRVISRFRRARRCTLRRYSTNSRRSLRSEH